jgi:hypothetical protein
MEQSVVKLHNLFMKHNDLYKTAEYIYRNAKKVICLIVETTGIIQYNYYQLFKKVLN